jgi:zinc protease
VAGDVTPAEVEALARRYYEPLKNRRAVEARLRTPEPEPVAERRVIMRDARVSSPIWQRKYLTPAARHLPQREELAMSLLAEMLGGGSQSRLQQRLSVDQKIAAYTGAWFSSDFLDSGSFVVYAAPNPGVEASKIEAAVDAVLEDIRKNGVTRDELDRTRNKAIAEATYLLDSQQSLARVFGAALATGQSVEDVMNWEKDIATVTLEDISAAAARVLDLRASVTGLLLPEKGS